MGLGIGKQCAISVLDPLNGARFVTEGDGFFTQTIICYKWKKLFATITAMLLSCSFSYIVPPSLSKTGDCFNGCNVLTPSATPAGHLPNSHSIIFVKGLDPDEVSLGIVATIGIFGLP